ncbi:MAG: hypothetical protein WBD41_09805 [Rhodococcus sp. (in: high G+C Gram-positive bacteria)]|jgi:hypothetical protein|uniref:Uncharacterized protein n=2 Tax=Rhodococcus erythropolis group TaxID=2840174 RepID=A0AAW6LRB4_RHOSG|nr:MULTISPECIES: hypothetical protein [Rhodococcus]MDE8649029.1 hypothetical protein [Rhodococcus qingshengii]
MAELNEISVLEIEDGDRVHERNADWPQPFSDGDVYIYTAEGVDRLNEDTVQVRITGGDIPSAITYGATDTVKIEPR